VKAPRVIVTCVVCQKTLVEETCISYREAAYLLQGFVLKGHAGDHALHQLDARIEGLDLPRDRELKVTCRAKACKAPTRTWTTKVGVELVGAMVILFHTGHEGHNLEIVWDGRVWTTP
jgi:hypothetical protein